MGVQYFDTFAVRGTSEGKGSVGKGAAIVTIEAATIAIRPSSMSENSTIRYNSTYQYLAPQLIRVGDPYPGKSVANADF